MDVWIVLYVSTLLVVQGGSLFSLLDSFGISRHFLRVSSESFIRLTTLGGQFSGCKPRERSSIFTTPFTSGKIIIWMFHVTEHSKYLIAYLTLVTHFEAGVEITTNFPVNWPQCQRPWSKPFFEGAIFEESSLLRWLPLESHQYQGNHMFIFVVHSVFHLSHSRQLSSGTKQKIDPSSVSKLKFIAAWATLDKITWFCHMHQPSVK